MRRSGRCEFGYISLCLSGGFRLRKYLQLWAGDVGPFWLGMSVASTVHQLQCQNPGGCGQDSDCPAGQVVVAHVSRFLLPNVAMPIVPG